jgi:hypothetical protein
MPWAGALYLIYTSTRFRSRWGVTTAKASLWYSSSLARFVRIERKPIFGAIGTRPNMGVWGQGFTVELTGIAKAH